MQLSKLVGWFYRHSVRQCVHRRYFITVAYQSQHACLDDDVQTVPRYNVQFLRNFLTSKFIFMVAIMHT